MTDLLYQHFGREFHLGGLSGIPFVGTTGFGAYTHHVSMMEHGHCFVLLATHVGLSATKRLGHITTTATGSINGSSKSDTVTTTNLLERPSCGAAVAAMDSVLAATTSSSSATSASFTPSFDFQQEYILQQVQAYQHEFDGLTTDSNQYAPSIR